MPTPTTQPARPSPGDEDTVLEPGAMIVAVPDGWELLPAGPTRRLRVDPLQVGHRRGVPCVVTEVGRPLRQFARVSILGPSRLVHDRREHPCGSVYLETQSALLVRL